MKKEDVLNLMTELPPDLIEEAGLQAPARRRLPRLARAGLIAACLCLVLIGTAAAVHFSGLYLVEGDGGITPVTARWVAEAGATVLVAGSAIYGSDDTDAAIRALRTAAGSPAR